MSGVYSMTGGPSYTGASRQDLFDSAMNQPLSWMSTMVDQTKGGILESFGLGTAIKDLTTPQGNEQQSVTEPAFGMAAIPIPGAYTLFKAGVQALTDQGQPLTEDAYKGSASYRKDIPWDAGMTDTRAAALAASDDAKKVREYYATKRPFWSFVGGMAGQALDPVNYVPVFGEAVTAAAIGRFGYIGGRALIAGADAAINTGIAGAATAGPRGQFGDDVSWQGLISQMATAAMIGGAFGTLHGVFGSRVDARAMSEAESRLATLRTTQEARIAMNEGIDAVAHGEDIKLSPNATEPMTRIASEMGPVEFGRWADGTKLVDEHGNPLVLYHQTAVENVASIERTGFDLNRIGARGSDEGMPDGVFLKATNENIGVGSVNKPSQMEVYAAIRNPLVVSDREALAKVLAQDETYAALKAEADALDTRLAKEYDDTYARLDAIAKAEGKRTVGQNGEIDALFARGNAELRDAAGKARARATEVLKEKGYDGVVMEKDAGSFGRSVRTIIAFNPDQTRLRTRTVPPIDTTAARPDAPPEGIKHAEASIAKPEDTNNLAEQYRVDPKTGTFPEEADLHQLSAEGRFTEQDAATMAQAQADYETGASFAEALKSVAGCLI